MTNRKPLPSEYERRPYNPPPQPLATGGAKLPEDGLEEADAFSRWLTHVEAGRVGVGGT